MKHSILALPALLRPAIILAAASQTTFSVQDDLLAFPQYEVRFSEDYVSESQAQIHLDRAAQSGDEAPPSHVEQYHGRLGEDDQQQKDEERLAYESMILDGQRYLCTIPIVPKASSPEANTAMNDTVSKADEEKELARATDRGWELLSGMQGNCVYFISGWWSYKFCYNDGVRQFHQLPPSRGVPVYPPVEDPGVEGFMLGRYGKGAEKDDVAEEESGKGKEGELGGLTGALDVSETAAKKKVQSSALGELVQRGESRYLVQRLEGGTKCDLTNRERRIEVQVRAATITT